MVAEVVGGFLSGSLALLADAGHMLTDVMALVIASVAVALSSLPADDRRTYGYRRLEILAALINGVALVVVSISIVIEALINIATMLRDDFLIKHSTVQLESQAHESCYCSELKNARR